jgi:uncharacterized protein YecE (DUF72 family)
MDGEKSSPGKQAPTSAPRARILVGPAGWSYPDWKGIVYPMHRTRAFHEAEYLAQFFDTIEINTSFYNPLRPEMCRQWLSRISQNPAFLFTAKLWQRFTHEASLAPADVRAVRPGFDILRDAGRLGAVLLQFPFSFHNTPETHAHLEKLLDLFRDYPLVVEMRHSTWNNKEFFGFLHRRDAGFCNIDQPLIGRSMRPTERATSVVGYVRLHGRRYDTWFTDDPASPPEERYNYLYSPEELEPWAARIEKVAGHSKTTFVITNNHYQGKAIVNALQLIRLITGQKVKLPETLRQHYPQLESIASEPAREATLFPLGTSSPSQRE